MKEVEVWKHQAGWGSIGITSGIIFGPACILALNFAQDPSVYTSISGILRSIGVELVVSIVLGWLVGSISAWIFYESASNKTPTIFRNSASGIARRTFIIIFILASIYYLVSGTDENVYPLVFWITGALGLFVSGPIGSVFARNLLRNTGY